ncbi:MAG: hypothetical protein ACOYOT_02140 [Bacteroidales bacterium]
MIEFEKNPKRVLPYNREYYMNFFDDEFDSHVEWYGVSYQLDSEEYSLAKFIETYKYLFETIVSNLDNGSFWIVNHDDKDLKWFPNAENNLASLRALFKQRNVPNSFKGALVFTKDTLFEFYKDLISYPYAVYNKENLLYKNLDISHGKIPFIIKVSGHLCIDLLSTDKLLLRKIVAENSSNIFKIKEYRGTSLWTSVPR